MLKVGVLGYVVPLLFGFDLTHEAEASAPGANASAVASLAAVPEEAPGQRDTGPAYLGLGTSRSNMQASPSSPHHENDAASTCPQLYNTAKAPRLHLESCGRCAVGAQLPCHAGSTGAGQAVRAAPGRLGHAAL